MKIKDLKDGESGYWYLATVYSSHKDNIYVAFVEACRLSWCFIKEGVPVFSPIAHTHPIAVENYQGPFDHEIWLPADEELMKSARGMVVAKMKNWEISKGIGYEIERFRQVGKPIYYLDIATSTLTHD